MAEDDKTKFWVFLIGALLAVSVLVLLLDMGIKSAILEESNALKRTMNEVKWNGAGPGPDKADSNGASDHGSDDASNDGDNVSVFPPRMEAPVVRSRRSRKTSPGPMAGTIEHSERNGNGGLAPDSKQVDS
jgi:hypothetical protein